MFMQSPQLSITLQLDDGGYTCHIIDPIRDSRVDILYKRTLNKEMTAAQAYEIFTKATGWLSDAFSNSEAYSVGGCIDKNDENFTYEISI